MGVKIGITALHNEVLQEMYLPDKFTTIIAENGGVPIILPVLSNEKGMIEFLEYLDGLIVLEHYKNDNQLDIIRAAVKISIPILGIGGGLYAINAALGGTVKTTDPEAIDVFGKGLIVSQRAIESTCKIYESDNMKDQYIVCIQDGPELWNEEEKYRIISDFIQAAYMKSV